MEAVTRACRKYLELRKLQKGNRTVGTRMHHKWLLSYIFTTISSISSYISQKKRTAMEKKDEVVLLDLATSPFAARVRIAFSEKGVEYESKEEDILHNKSPLLYEMNPVHKRIPVLIHNGRPICESMNIVQYIDEVWNHKSPLLPSDPYQRAHARFWADYVDNKIYPIGSVLWKTSDAERKEASKKDLIECFRTLEAELGDKPFFDGESFGYIDLSLIPFSTLFYTFEILGNMTMEAVCPKIVAWSKRCLEKESVSKSLCDPHESYQVVLKLKKFYGVE